MDFEGFNLYYFEKLLLERCRTISELLERFEIIGHDIVNNDVHFVISIERDNKELQVGYDFHRLLNNDELKAFLNEDYEKVKAIPIIIDYEIIEC